MTGLKGHYDLTYNLHGAPANSSFVDYAAGALEDQLGLRMELRKVRMDVLIIDHVERPTGN